MSDPIVIVEYDAEWPEEFARLRDRAQAALGALAVAIEHVGSTAVPGLAGKPVIDLVAVIASNDDLPEAIRRLERLGYRARGDQGVSGREVFHWPEREPRHHLYVSPSNSDELRAQLRFRDRLRTEPELAGRYERLKRELAVRYREDRPGYTEAKTSFVVAASRAGSTSP